MRVIGRRVGSVMLVPLQPCHLFLPWVWEEMLWLQLAQGMRCMGPECVLLPMEHVLG